MYIFATSSKVKREDAGTSRTVSKAHLKYLELLCGLDHADDTAAFRLSDYKAIESDFVKTLSEEE